jgi:hypothetical protein
MLVRSEIGLASIHNVLWFGDWDGGGWELRSPLSYSQSPSPLRPWTLRASRHRILRTSWIRTSWAWIPPHPVA